MEFDIKEIGKRNMDNVVVGQDSGGIMFSAKAFNDQHSEEICKDQGATMNRHAKSVSEYHNDAAEICDETRKVFNTAINNLVAKKESVAAACKSVSQDVRKSANDLMTGMQKIDKLSNFDKLERQVALLERAASAMSALADLEKTGKLDRIMKAIS